MAIVAGKTIDFQGIAGFLMGLKPDIVSETVEKVIYLDKLLSGALYGRKKEK